MTRPAGPTSLQLLRAVPSIRRFAPGFLVAVAQQFGDLVAFPVPEQAVFLAASPAAADDVLVRDPRAWTKDTQQYVSLSRLTGAGLLTSDGQAWRDHRRLLAAAYPRAGLQRVKDVASAATHGLLPDDGAARTLDVQEEFGVLSLEILGGAVLGVDLRAQAAALVRSVMVGLDTVIADVEAPQPLPAVIPTRRRRRFQAAQAHIDTAARELLDAGAPDGLLGLLTSAVAEGELSARQARDELVTTIVAGHETVASALSWTLWLLARHPHWQDRARNDGEVMRAVVDEGLRLYPPAWVMSRRCVRETVVAGQAVPVGALAIISPWQLHRRPDVFPDPLTFDPGRFLDRRPPRTSYLPFGAGPRLCIGRDVALAELNAVLAEALRRASFSPAGPAPVMRAGVTLSARHGVWLRATPR